MSEPSQIQHLAHQLWVVLLKKKPMKRLTLFLLLNESYSTAVTSPRERSTYLYRDTLFVRGRFAEFENVYKKNVTIVIGVNPLITGLGRVKRRSFGKCLSDDRLCLT